MRFSAICSLAPSAGECIDLRQAVTRPLKDWPHGLRSNSGSATKFASICRASSLVSSLAAERRPRTTKDSGVLVERPRRRESLALTHPIVYTYTDSDIRTAGRTMETIEKERIEDIAKRVATANLGVTGISSAISSPTIDSTGRAALEITIVLTPGSSAAITGRTAANTVLALNQALQEAGEERFPIVRWVAK
jgi:hypothetical protein